MKMKIFAIRDRATDQYSNPQFLITAGQAIRTFSDEINNSKTEHNNLNKHADDYDLYELGVFDTDNGTFDTTSPKMIAIGKDLLINK